MPLRPAERVTILLTKGQSNTKMVSLTSLPARMTCFLRPHCCWSPRVPLGVQVQEKVQTESGQGKQGNAQRKSEGVKEKSWEKSGSTPSPVAPSGGEGWGGPPRRRGELHAGSGSLKTGEGQERTTQPFKKKKMECED